MPNIEDLINLASDHCQENRVNLIFLVKFGSHLYGTSSEDSDTDLRGVFLPSLSDLILERAPKDLSIKSGNNESRNSSEDYDITLWSVSKWLNLLREGDTGALDLLFANTYDESWLLTSWYSEVIWRHANFLIPNDRTITKCVEYAFGQAKKYGLKGSRVNALQVVCDYLNEGWSYDCFGLPFQVRRVEYYAEEICKKFEISNEYVYVTEKSNEKYLNVCGKLYGFRTKILDFREKIQKAFDTYGERALLAAQNEGIDWKAISHAIRAAYQTLELFETGEISFPRKEAELLKKIKNGLYSWERAETEIIEVLDKVRALDPAKASFKFDDIEASDIILRLYNQQV